MDENSAKVGESEDERHLEVSTVGMECMQAVDSSRLALEGGSDHNLWAENAAK